MTRFIALVIIVLLLWMAVENLLRRARRTPLGRQMGQLFEIWRRGGAPSPERRRSRSGGVTLVRCRECGTHVPQSHALGLRDGEFLCEGCSHRRS